MWESREHCSRGHVGVTGGETSHRGQGSQQQPRDSLQPKFVLLPTEKKRNHAQLLCSDPGGRGHLSQTGRKQIHEHLRLDPAQHSQQDHFKACGLEGEEVCPPGSVHSSFLPDEALGVRRPPGCLRASAKGGHYSIPTTARTGPSLRSARPPSSLGTFLASQCSQRK